MAPTNTTDSGKFVRASKYRHVFGQAAKRELCYENLKITKNAWDSNIIQSNGKYLAVNWDASGGGAFAIVPVAEVGKAPDQVPLFRGHTGPVLDTAFDPFNQERLASCSDDGKICIWEVPSDYSFHKYVDEEENIKDITEPIMVLKGHTRKVGKVVYHPVAQNILASSSLDYTVKIWNLTTGKDVITLQHKDLVTSFAFNYNGSLLVTTSRDKTLRIWDIRTGKILSEGPGHTGAKPSRVCWLGNTDRIVTTGFSRLSDRQIGIWDVNDISAGPIGGYFVIDASSGVLIPFFDESNLILYLAGKGDGNIRYYEYEYEGDELFEISQYSSTDPQRGVAVAPKNSVNVKENEISRCYKTIKDLCIEPISFYVPRRSELFQSDIYPDCPSHEPALSEDEWLGGKDVNGPLLLSMEDLYEGVKPSLRESSKPEVPASKKEELKKEAPKKEEPKKAEPKVVKEESPKPVDELLRSSNLVNNMLDKVNDASDNEVVEEDGDDWEEVQKPTPPKEEASSVSAPAVKETPKEAPKVESAPIVKKEATPAPSPAAAADVTPVLSAPEASKAVPTPTTAPATTSTAKTGAPTLKSMVEKLHTLIERLENQVVTLTEAGLEKDARLKTLEEKIETLLQK